ncbi:MerR family transcriptional regulator [Desulfosarcina ovata]|uniref:MerR family transcriptional regulator n=1 Tax=Desulfosarcina ovata subsp. ovata TaxID=2752305 RepID=A0A5K8AGT3_9BACT|nr:MerR family transcriptional regulator [Desulfosarcina ovata]BBO91895.1 MerR family transcriptional regulator [Desulfosarcina ovata subsp. ovata]
MTADRSGEAAVPDKFYFKIGEVSDIAGVPSYVLRFWETEFKQIKPKRTEAGQRLYRRQDVVLILKIKQLLYEKKFTIEGARQHLRQRSGRAVEPDPPGTPPDLTDIRDELIRIRDMIDAHRR